MGSNKKTEPLRTADEPMEGYASYGTWDYEPQTVKGWAAQVRPDKVSDAAQGLKSIGTLFEECPRALYGANERLWNAWTGGEGPTEASRLLGRLVLAAGAIQDAAQKAGTSLERHVQPLKSFQHYWTAKDDGFAKDVQDGVVRDSDGKVYDHIKKINVLDPNTDRMVEMLDPQGEGGKGAYGDWQKQTTHAMLTFHNKSISHSWTDLPKDVTIDLPEPPTPGDSPGPDPRNPGDARFPGAGPGTHQYPHTPAGSPHFPDTRAPAGAHDLPSYLGNGAGDTPYQNHSTGTDLSGLPHGNPSTGSPGDGSNPFGPGRGTGIPTGHGTEGPGAGPHPLGLLPSGGRPRAGTIPSGLGTPGPNGAHGRALGSPGEPTGGRNAAGRAISGAAAEEAGALGAANAARGGTGMMPFMPMGGAHGAQEQGRERVSWETEDPSIWGVDEGDVAPSIIE